MHSHIDRDYVLTHTLDVPEMAPMPRIRSARAATVAGWFGIEELIDPPVSQAEQNKTVAEFDHRRAREERALLRSLLPRANQITFLTGPSGAGKSSLLRALRKLRPACTFMDLSSVDSPAVPLVDCFPATPLDQTLALLSQVGLAEAWTYLRTPDELSEGQRWRLKLALAIRRSAEMSSPNSPGVQASVCKNVASENSETCRLKPARRGNALSQRRVSHRLILLADEFAAVLDRVTAAIVARCLRRAVSATPQLCAIVATSHDDLTRGLAPDTIVHCDFRLIEVRRLKNPKPIEFPRPPKRSTPQQTPPHRRENAVTESSATPCTSGTTG